MTEEVLDMNDLYEDRIIAIRRDLEGEKPASIYTSLHHSRPWFFKLDDPVFAYADSITTLALYSNDGVASNRPKSRPTICLLDSVRVKTSLARWATNSNCS